MLERDLDASWTWNGVDFKLLDHSVLNMLSCQSLDHFLMLAISNPRILIRLRFSYLDRAKDPWPKNSGFCATPLPAAFRHKLAAQDRFFACALNAPSSRDHGTHIQA